MFFDAQTVAELAERERPHALSVERSVEVLDQLLKGLSVAHGNGLVHRDIKPSNIMFSQEGQLRLVDFGIAKSPDAKYSSISHVGMGSRNYMAREQRESAKHVDARADVYAVGC